MEQGAAAMQPVDADEVLRVVCSCVAVRFGRGRGSQALLGAKNALFGLQQ